VSATLADSLATWRYVSCPFHRAFHRSDDISARLRQWGYAAHGSWYGPWYRPSTWRIRRSRGLHWSWWVPGWCPHRDLLQVRWTQSLCPRLSGSGHEVLCVRQAGMCSQAPVFCTCPQHVTPSIRLTGTARNRDTSRVTAPPRMAVRLIPLGRPATDAARLDTFLATAPSPKSTLTGKLLCRTSPVLHPLPRLRPWLPRRFPSPRRLESSPRVGSFTSNTCSQQLVRAHECLHQILPLVSSI
jgi:hypothetical protein